jgi:hypothetical protein
VLGLYNSVVLYCIVEEVTRIYLNNEPQKATYFNKVLLYIYIYIYYYYNLFWHIFWHL